MRGVQPQGHPPRGGHQRRQHRDLRLLHQERRAGAGPRGSRGRGRRRPGGPRGVLRGVVVGRAEDPEHRRGRKRRRLGRRRVRHVLSSRPRLAAAQRAVPPTRRQPRARVPQRRRADDIGTRQRAETDAAAADAGVLWEFLRGREPGVPRPVGRAGPGSFKDTWNRDVLQERPVRVRGQQSRYVDRGGVRHDGHRPGVPHPGRGGGRHDLREEAGVEPRREATPGGDHREGDRQLRRPRRGAERERYIDTGVDDVAVAA